MKGYLIYCSILFIGFWFSIFWIEFGNGCGNRKRKLPFEGYEMKISKELKKFIK